MIPRGKWYTGQVIGQMALKSVVEKYSSFDIDHKKVADAIAAAAQSVFKDAQKKSGQGDLMKRAMWEELAHAAWDIREIIRRGVYRRAAPPGQARNVRQLIENVLDQATGG
jgi:hypothetical protein